MKLFELYGSIIIDDKLAVNSLQKVNKVGSKLTKGFGRMGKVMTGAFAVKVAVAVVAFGKKVVEASADLKAMEAQFDQVFKDGENKKALEGINKQVDDLGIHADRLTGSWNKFGGQVKGAGMEGEKALTAVDKATRLAADGAAFYDKSLESSSDSLASFMKGNFAAGDAIGVFTNAKQMDVKSNDMYGKSWADLTESERQWLLLDTVEKTYEMNGAMGQAARESSSYENVMGNFNATFERLWAVIGEPVLEVVLVVAQKLTSWIEDNMPLIEKTVKGTFEAIKESWKTFSQPVLDAMLYMFKGVFIFIKDNWPEIQTVIDGVFNRIEWQWNNILWPVFETYLKIQIGLLQFILDNFPGMQTTVKNVFEGIGKTVEKVTGIFSDITGAIKKAYDWLTGNNTDIPRNATAYNGLSYVPIEGYVTELHKGERVLTVKENQTYSKIDGGNLASQIMQRLIDADITKKATVILDGKVVGKGLIKIVDNGSIVLPL